MKNKKWISGILGMLTVVMVLLCSGAGLLRPLERAVTDLLYSRKYKVNNKIYKVDYDNLTYELVYEFENSDASYLGGYVQDNVYYMKQGVIKRGWFIFKGKEKFTSYKLDLSTFELSVDKENKIDNKEIVKETVEFNNDIYYMEKVGFGLALSKPYGVYIYN